MRLVGKAALITGATGAIGGAIARRFVAAGARVVVSGSRAAWAVSPDGARYVPADLTDEDAVRSLVTTAVAELSGLDILVNAHGIDYHSDLVATPLEDVERVLAVNVVGALLTMKYAIPAMIEAGGGAIINLASRLGSVAIPGQAVYSASKGALIMLSRGAAIDVAKHKIRVNCVAPGVTATPMIDVWIAEQADPIAFSERVVGAIPLRRMATVDDVAAATLFLASDEAAYITGAVLPVDGGYTAA